MNATASVRATVPDMPPFPGVDSEVTSHDVFQRIGAITRRLHDALRELGYDKTLEHAVDSLPDARARLSRIAELTGESAEKVLNTVEVARAVQDQIRGDAGSLEVRWAGRTVQALSGPEGDLLVADTRKFLGGLPASTDLTNRYLSDIMLAQDFHDLTGQMIGKVVDLAQTLEEQLVALLLETTPPERRARAAVTEAGSLSGPAVNTAGRTDIVTDQSQVDDLLESLGF
jgi:chemotaxis protein CheZ